MADGVINYKAVAKNVRIARAKLGMTQKELALRSGVCEATIVFIENAKNGMVRMSTLRKLTYPLGLELEDLLKEDE